MQKMKGEFCKEQQREDQRTFLERSWAIENLERN